MSKIGITGTSAGVTPQQVERLRAMLQSLVQPPPHEHELHHGDCVGADAEAHKLAIELGLRVLIHPGVFANGKANDKRAYCQGAQFVFAPMTMFARNREIVDDTNFLIALPRLMTEESEGGTWYTINYARKRPTVIFIIWPDGHVTKEYGKGFQEPA